MADRIGVLDAASTVTATTTTAYTVPAGCAARVRILFRGVAGSNSTLAILINGMTIMLTAALTSGTVSYSTYSVLHKNDAAASIVGSADGTTVAPFQREYFLSANDTIQYTIGTAAFSSMDFQVVGVEVVLPT